MEMTDNNNNSTSSKEPLHLEQPLLSPQHQADNNNRGTHQRSFGGPRILDRDGTFAQSRGRWSVSNTRQRYHGSGTTGSANNLLHRDEEEDDDGGPPDFYATSPPRRRNLATHTTSSSPFQRLYTRLACFKSSYCFAKSNNSRQPRNSSLTRRCWDDWFHTLSYTPTCILMLGVFAAYFVTIVIFAGLYLAVNKFGGERYNGGGGGGVNPDELDVAAAGGGIGRDNADAETMENDINMLETSSFCGMDINNHMEGECCSVFIGIGFCSSLRCMYFRYSTFSRRFGVFLVTSSYHYCCCMQHSTLASPRWPQSAMALPTTTLASVGHPSF